MARGFSNALRLALGAVEGGMEGYGAKQERLAKASLLKQQQERQEEREANALARELSRDQRAAVAQGWQEAGAYSGLSPRDMPGATPRKPFAATMIGDKSYVMPESEQVGAHRESLMKEQQLKRQEKIQQEALRESAKAAGLDPRKIEVLQKAPPAVQGVLAARLFPAPERSREGKAEPSDEEKEAIGLQFISAQARNPALMRALQTAYTQDPALAARPGLLAYDIKKNRTVPLQSASGGYNPQKPKQSAPSLLDTLSPQSQQVSELQQAWDEAAAATSIEVATKRLGPRPQ
jgi:hypothetical protein